MSTTVVAGPLRDLVARFATALDDLHVHAPMEISVIDAVEFTDRADPRAQNHPRRPATAAEVNAAVDLAQKDLRELPGIIASWGQVARAQTEADWADVDARMAEAVTACPLLVSPFAGTFLRLADGTYVPATWLTDGPALGDYDDASSDIARLRELVRRFASGTATDTAIRELAKRIEPYF